MASHSTGLLSSDWLKKKLRWSIFRCTDARLYALRAYFLKHSILDFGSKQYAGQYTGYLGVTTLLISTYLNRKIRFPNLPV